MFITLKPLAERKISADQVIGRLRRKLAVVPGATLFLQSAQDLTIGGRMSHAQYQYTLQGENLNDLNHWAPRLLQQIAHACRNCATSTPTSRTRVWRPTGHRPRHRLAPGYHAARHRQRSVRCLRPAPGFHHVHAAEPVSRGDGSGSAVSSRLPTRCRLFTCGLATGRQVPLAAFAHFEPSNTPLAVNHQGQFPSVTILVQPRAGRVSGRGDARPSTRRERAIDFPPTIHASFQGTAAAFQDLAGQRAYPDSAQRWSRSTSCSACCTRATSIPSRFSRRCRPPAWAPFWRCC